MEIDLGHFMPVNTMALAPNDGQGISIWSDSDVVELFLREFAKIFCSMDIENPSELPDDVFQEIANDFHITCSRGRLSPYEWLLDELIRRACFIILPRDTSRLIASLIKNRIHDDMRIQYGQTTLDLMRISTYVDPYILRAARTYAGQATLEYLEEMTRHIHRHLSKQKMPNGQTQLDVIMLFMFDLALSAMSELMRPVA